MKFHILPLPSPNSWTFSIVANDRKETLLVIPKYLCDYTEMETLSNRVTSWLESRATEFSDPTEKKNFREMFCYKNLAHHLGYTNLLEFNRVRGDPLENLAAGATFFTGLARFLRSPFGSDATMNLAYTYAIWQAFQHLKELARRVPNQTQLLPMLIDVMHQLDTWLKSDDVILPALWLTSWGNPTASLDKEGNATQLRLSLPLEACPVLPREASEKPLESANCFQNNFYKSKYTISLYKEIP